MNDLKPVICGGLTTYCYYDGGPYSTVGALMALSGVLLWRTKAVTTIGLALGVFSVGTLVGSC